MSDVARTREDPASPKPTARDEGKIRAEVGASVAERSRAGREGICQEVAAEDHQGILVGVEVRGIPQAEVAYQAYQLVVGVGAQSQGEAVG